jgi:hypothetical protein
MEIKIINPKVYRIEDKFMVGASLDLAGEDQIEDFIRRILLDNSIVADKIEINNKKIIIPDFKQAQDFLDDEKERRTVV